MSLAPGSTGAVRTGAMAAEASAALGTNAGAARRSATAADLTHQVTLTFATRHSGVMAGSTRRGGAAHPGIALYPGIPADRGIATLKAPANGAVPLTEFPAARRSLDEAALLKSCPGMHADAAATAFTVPAVPAFRTAPAEPSPTRIAAPVPTWTMPAIRIEAELSTGIDKDGRLLDWIELSREVAKLA